MVHYTKRKPYTKGGVQVYHRLSGPYKHSKHWVYVIKKGAKQIQVKHFKNLETAKAYGRTMAKKVGDKNPIYKNSSGTVGDLR